MSHDLESLIKRIKVRIRADDPTAIDDAVKLTEQYPDEVETWYTLAYGHARNRNYAAAIATMTRVMQLVPQEPGVYFDRGRHALMAADYELAIADFSAGLVLSEQLNDGYHREGLHFLRAEALFQVGRKAEALADLRHVPDDAVSWTIQIRSKAELAALCAE